MKDLRYLSLRPKLPFFLLATLLAAACSTNAHSPAHPQCDTEDCRAVAKKTSLKQSQQTGPTYYMGPHMSFSLGASPKSVKYSATSLILEWEEDKALIAMAVTADELGLPQSSNLTVAELFHWYFLKPFPQSGSNSLSPKALNNIKAFKQAFKLGSAQNLTYVEQQALRVIWLNPADDPVQRLYISSSEQPGIGYLMDLKGFNDEAINSLLQSVRNP